LRRGDGEQPDYVAVAHQWRARHRPIADLAPALHVDGRSVRLLDIHDLHGLAPKHDLASEAVGPDGEDIR